jgi:hypothetical protein
LNEPAQWRCQAGVVGPTPAALDAGPSYKELVCGREPGVAMLLLCIHRSSSKCYLAQVIPFGNLRVKACLPPVLPFGSFNSHPSEQAPAGELLFGHDSPASWLVASRNASVFRGCPLPSSAGLWSPTQRPTTLGSPPSPARGPSTSVRPARPSPARRPSTAPRPARVRRWTQEPSHFRLPPASGIAAIGPKLWFIPRIVVHPGPDQARPCGLRRSSSPGGPERRAQGAPACNPSTAESGR